jgi:uncharacterized protein YceK
MKKNAKILFVLAVLLIALVLSSGCSTITAMTDSFKSINIQSQAPVQKIDYNYQAPAGSGAAASGNNTHLENITINITPTEIPRFVYV